MSKVASFILCYNELCEKWSKIVERFKITLSFLKETFCFFQKLSKVSILDHFSQKNDHNSLAISWTTIKNATFDVSKNILGPVHLLTPTDKWDYL